MGRLDTGGAHLLPRDFHGAGVTRSVGERQMEIRRVERRALDELAHHTRHHMLVDGVDDAFRATKLQVNELLIFGYLVFPDSV